MVAKLVAAAEPAESQTVRLPGILVRLAPLLLAVVVIAAYPHAPWGDFSGDGYLLSVRAEQVHRVAASNFKTILTENYWYPIADSNLYRPVTTLSYLFNYAVLGNEDLPMGYHLFNLVVHLACVFLAYLVLMELFEDRLIAFFGAAIFAAHPVNAESVTNIAGRADLLFSFGLLGALWLHIRLDRYQGWPRRLAILGILSASLIAVFAKETGMVVSGLLLLYSWCVRSRPWKEVRASYAAVAAATCAAAAVRILLAKGWHAPHQFFLNNPLLGAPFWPARETAAATLWRQIALLFWPERLAWDRSYNQIPIVSWPIGMTALLGLIALTVIGLRLKQRFAPIGFLVLLALAAMFPSSNLILLINALGADRFLYLASLAFGGCVAAVVTYGCRRALGARGPIAAGVLLTAATGALCARAFERDADFADNRRLIRADVENAPNSYWVQYQAAVELFEDSQDMYSVDKALGVLQKSLDIIDAVRADESVPGPYAMKAVFLMKKAAHTDAPAERAAIYAQIVQLFDRAKLIDQAQRDELRTRDRARGWPTNKIPFHGVAMVYENSVRAFLELDRLADAEKDAAVWMMIEPMKRQTHEVMAGIYEREGRTSDAILELMEAERASDAHGPEPLLPALFEKAAPESCAIHADGTLNRDCALVREHEDRAHERLEQLLVRSGRA